MSLAQVLFPSPTDKGLEEWAHAHFQQHLAIINAMKEQKDILLPVRQIYPVDFQNPASLTVFLQLHSQMHNDFSSILGIQSNDLANVDFNNEDNRKAWFFLHYTSHQSATYALGMGIG